MSIPDGTIKRTDRFGQTYSYTPVTVKDKDTGKKFVINFTNCSITGNEKSWTIKNGQVVDKDGKTIEDRTIEVTKYQAALIKAAAAGDGDNEYLDNRDLIGAAYAENAAEALNEAKSEYRLRKDESNLVPDKNGSGYVPRLTPLADATEQGEFFAYVENNQGEKGKLNIDIRSEEDLQRDAQRKAEQQKIMEDANKPWWKFW